MLPSRFALAGFAFALCLSRCGGEAEHPGPPSRAHGPAPEFPAGSCSAEPAAPSRVLPLASGTKPERLRPGEVRGYDVRLTPGQYLHVVADQGEVDLLLCLYGPKGQLYLGLDSPNGRDEPEELLWRTKQGGTHRLLVRALTDEARPRGYRLTSQIGQATDRDPEKLAALSSAARAEEMLRGPDPSLLPRARDEYLSALARWTKLGDPGHQADLHERLGRLYERLKDLDRAAVSYERAREGFARLGARRREGLLLASLGRVSMALGRIDKALGYQRRALAVFEELKDPHEQAVALNEIGYLYSLLAEPQRALEAYSSSLERWHAAGEGAESAQTLHNRGLLYSSLGKYEDALDDLSEAADMARRAGGAHLAATLTALGNTWTLAGQPARALPLLEEALALRAKAHDRRGQAVTENTLGILLQRLRRPQEALDRHLRAQRIFNSLGDPRDKATALHNVGVALMEAGRPREAVPILAAAIRKGRELEDEELAEASLFSLAQIRSDQGDPGTALSLMQEALKEIESFRPRPPSQGLRAAFFATKQDYYSFTVDLLMDLDRQHPGQDHDREALNVSERSRARALLDLLQERSAAPAPNVPAGLLAARRRLEATLRAIVRLRDRQREESPSADTKVIDRELRRVLGKYNGVMADIRARNPSDPQTVQARPLTTEEIQQQVLDPGTVLLYYKFGRQRSYLWAVTPDSVASFILPPRRQIEGLASRLHDLLASTDRTVQGQTELTLRQLGDRLLKPARGLLGGKRLLILGEGALQSIPFAALPVPEAPGGVGGRPLILEHEVVTAPSASALAQGPRSRPRSRPESGPESPPEPRLERAAVFADAVYSPEDPRVVPRPGAPGHGSPEDRGGYSYDRLRNSLLEAQAIKSLVRADDLFTAINFAASRETVLSGVLKNYQIIHFATHAEVDSKNPELSRLVLSLVGEDGRPRDGFLYAYEIFGLDIPAELVVLSACRTGLGQEIRGEGLVGLPQAFLHAGAARVLVSLWDVNDLQTALLFQSFYDHLLRQGMTPSAALRAAQIERFRKRPWPYDWAAFVLHDR